MNQNKRDRELEDLLTARAPSPPPELLETLKSEIDLDHLRSRRIHQPTWLVAATVVAALGIGALGSAVLFLQNDVPGAHTTTAEKIEPPTTTERSVDQTGSEIEEPEQSQPSPQPETTLAAPSETAGFRSTTELAQRLESIAPSIEPESAPAPAVEIEEHVFSIPDPAPARPSQSSASERRRALAESVEFEAPDVVSADDQPRTESSKGAAAPEPPRTRRQIHPPTSARSPASPPPRPPSQLIESFENKRLDESLGSGTTPAQPSLNIPNGAPYADVFFQGSGTNPFIDTDDDSLSTFGLDVDTASYSIARSYLDQGHLPPAAAVRVEEFVNYFDYGDPALEPRPGEEFSITAEGAPALFAPSDDYQLLRIHLQGRDPSRDKVADARPASDLVIVVDISGSMAQGGRLELVKQSLGLLLDNLDQRDRVALVTFGSQARVVVPFTHHFEHLRHVIAGLQTRGSTNAEGGLALGYQLADQQRREGTIRRVILCSDGVANVGETAAEKMLEQIRVYAQRGIELTTVGFGMGNYNDHLMESLADNGNGRYAYVDSLAEARQLFVEKLTGTLLTIAADARAQIEFDPRVVSRYRLLGYENRNIADQRFRDDTVDAGEIGAGHQLTVLYQLKLHRQPKQRQRVATVHLRYASTTSRRIVEQQLEIRGRDFSPTWQQASSALRMSSLVADFAEVLKETYWARSYDLTTIFGLAQKTAAELDQSSDRAALAELVSLMGKAESMRHQM